MIAVKNLGDFIESGDQLPMIDVRSEGEFERGHIPGSINIPLLNNDERKQVGTLYKHMGKEAAIMKGFQLVGPRFYDIFKLLRKSAREQTLQVYCWRGGMRSNIMGWMMNLSDYKVSLLRGGYKTYREFTHELFSIPRHWIVISGKTGAGKTRVLQGLEAAGEQVLDFERLANHRGSAFGHLGLPPQPTVEHFENLIAWTLKAFDPEQPVWIENESRFIGTVRVPDAIFNQTLQMPVVELHTSDDHRKRNILEEYGNFSVELLTEATCKLERKLGGDRMKEACHALETGDRNTWLEILLTYYDKTYSHSNKIRTGEVSHLQLKNSDEEAIQQLLQLKESLWMKQEH